METKEVLLKIRKQHSLSQDEMASKLFVTRQAVSRWENGDTVPNTETLKLISKNFDISINTLLGQPRQLVCQACSMPLTDEIMSRFPDGAFNEELCQWCGPEGIYAGPETIDEMVEVCMPHSGLLDNAESREQMKAYLSQFKHWKTQEA